MGAVIFKKIRAHKRVQAASTEPKLINAAMFSRIGHLGQIFDKFGDKFQKINKRLGGGEGGVYTHSKSPALSGKLPIFILNFRSPTFSINLQLFHCNIYRPDFFFRFFNPHFLRHFHSNIPFSPTFWINPNGIIPLLGICLLECMFSR